MESMVAPETRPARASRTGKIIITVAGLFLLVNAVWLGWRFFGPVTVYITYSQYNLPFTIETSPTVVSARPGETVSVIYRIKNNSMTPVNATGTLIIEPASATDQVKIFVTQCSGLNAYQANLPQEYQVVFRVQPAGLTGEQTLNIRHEFRSVGNR
ncbi:MAG: hypothetical protein HZB53_07150 [Chloroflexi bacterium]|nr:hypothetical protein [Chloroflexota bacterium]